jgi:hypothetical protein
MTMTSLSSTTYSMQKQDTAKWLGGSGRGRSASNRRVTSRYADAEPACALESNRWAPMEAKAAPRSGRRWGAVRMAEAGRTPDAACDALGEVARADESQAERIRGSGGGLDGRRRHRREESAAGFSQLRVLMMMRGGGRSIWQEHPTGPDRTRVYNKRRGKMAVPSHLVCGSPAVSSPTINEHVLRYTMVQMARHMASLSLNQMRTP